MYYYVKRGKTENYRFYSSRSAEHRAMMHIPRWKETEMQKC